MTQKDYNKIKEACKKFREENLRAEKFDDHIEMLLPMLYDDNDGACIFITP